MEPTIDVGPEKVIAESRSFVHVVTTSAHRLLTSPGYEVTCMIDSPVPSEHEWSPPVELTSELLHSLPANVTRLTMRFEKL